MGYGPTLEIGALLLIDKDERKAKQIALDIFGCGWGEDEDDVLDRDLEDRDVAGEYSPSFAPPDGDECCPSNDKELYGVWLRDSCLRGYGDSKPLDYIPASIEKLKAWVAENITTKYPEIQVEHLVRIGNY